MIYSVLTYINSIDDDIVGLTMKLNKSAETPKVESRQNVIFNRYMLRICKMRDSEEGQ